MATARAPRRSRNPARPVGRDAVVAAVVRAAGELFAERGPNATTMRDIAERSGVNYGLVHRHFGTKRDLLAVVLDHLSAEVAALTEQGPMSQALAVAVERNWRVLARSILDGYPVGQLQQQFPYVAGLIERARPHQPSELAARLAAGNTIALELGWRLFETFVRSAAGLEDLPPGRLRESIETTTATILDPVQAQAARV